VTRHLEQYDYISSVLDITASHHAAFGVSLATDVLKESIAKKNANSLQFRAAIEDCNGMYSRFTVRNASTKQIENQSKELLKKRDQILKKSVQGDISKQLADLEELSKKYDGLKAVAETKKEAMKNIVTVFSTSVKDDIRRTLVHFISLLKNVEYDVNAEVEVSYGLKEIR
jgi:seryl-tRNA synthetase